MVTNYEFNKKRKKETKKLSKILSRIFLGLKKQSVCNMLVTFEGLYELFLFLSAVFLELLPIYSTDVPWDLSFST
jgi:hypothetical protein